MEGENRKRKKHKSEIFYYLVIRFLAGVASAYFFYFPKSMLFLLILFIKRKYFLFGVLFFLFGNFYFQFHVVPNNKSFIHAYNETNKDFTAQILDEVDTRIDHTKLIVTLNEPTKNLKGKVLLKVNRFPRYKFGDILKIQCNLKEPAIFNEFNYKKYLERYKIYSVCYYPKIVRLKPENLNFVQALYSNIFWFKAHIEFAIRKTIHEPYASFLAGLLLGVRRGISPDLMEAFNKTGTTHIIAVSGYNISLIASILMGILPRFYVTRKVAAIILFISLILFTIITGMSASVVRAAIMGGLVILSRLIGRGAEIKNVILFAVLLMILANPYILMYDIGFHLSLFSTLGLIYLHPIVNYFSKHVPENFGIRESFSTTVASMVSTLPFVFFYFGRVSFISILVNILILPTLPFAMLSGFIAVMISFVSIDFAQGIQWITFLILHYVILIITFFG